MDAVGLAGLIAVVLAALVLFAALTFTVKVLAVILLIVGLVALFGGFYPRYGTRMHR